MPFSETIKLEIKRKAHFTCCWCTDRDNKVDVHHIVPQAEGGPDTEGNGAPLCGSCHDKYGHNPEMRKEIRSRRDHWYELCEKRFQVAWPIGFDVPLLDYYRVIPPGLGMTHNGIQFTDKDPSNKENPPLLYITIHFKTSRYFGDDFSGLNQKWLHIQADMRFAFSLRVQVRASNLNDELETRNFLRGANQRWLIQGDTPEKVGQVDEDILLLWRESREKRLQIATYAPTHAAVSVNARFSDKIAQAFDGYLNEKGFENPATYRNAF
jgi:hypothetical protein